MNEHDTLARFARAHLSGEAEPAVYFLLAGSPAASWSAEELSERTGWPEGVVAEVLGRFLAAGMITPATDDPAAPRYRWRVEAEYLHDSPSGATEWVDPVCGMPVAEDSPISARRPDGTTVRFCSPWCRTAFLGATNRSPGGRGPAKAVEPLRARARIGRATTT